MKKNRRSTKKQKNMRKKLLTAVSGVIFVGLIVGVCFYGKGLLEQGGKQSETVINSENELSDDQNIEDFELAREIYFVEDEKGNKQISPMIDERDKVLGKYTCKNLGCGNFDYLPSPSGEHYFLNNNLVLISEWNGKKYETIVYNYQTNQVVESYDEAFCSYEFTDGSFAILVGKDNKIGILSSNGKLVHDLTLDNLKHSDSDDVCRKMSNYSADSGYKYPGYDGMNGVLAKNGKYGVVNLKNGEIIVDFKYDGIRLMYDGNYAVKEGNKWYLLDQKLIKVFNLGYDEIYSFGEVILVGTNVSADIVQYKLIDNKGNDLTNAIEIDFLQMDVYRKVTSGVIEVGLFSKGTFTYDLTKKTLNYK